MTKTITHPNKPTGMRSAHLWHCDTAPSNSEGNDGDLCVNDGNGTLYEKVNGVWQVIASLE